MIKKPKEYEGIIKIHKSSKLQHLLVLLTNV